MLRRTGEGWINFDQHKKRPILYLQNFDIDGTALKPKHQEALRKGIAPNLENGCSVTLVGMTDRLGSAQYNKQLSVKRADAVLRFLRKNTKNGFRVQQQLAAGERRAASHGMRDNSRGDAYRAVAVVLWPSPQPKKLNPQEIALPETPGVPFFSKYGWILDVAGGVTDAVGIFTSAVFVELLGGFFAVVGPILAGIVTIVEADRNAKFNGYCEGIWLGMQKLADQYKNPKLDETALDEWPHLKQPKIPHRRGDLIHHRYGKLVHEGRNEGAKHVFDFVKKLEREPKEITLHGVKQKRRVGGRLMLRALSKQKGIRVGEWMQGEVAKELDKRKIGPWPLGGPRKR